ncbi:MAG TPA: hemolysin family protein, partial [Thermoanaerobaculia bacterium]|nr:hemolysin family protein [Thermoanaerobaculia bacterium]
LYPLVAMLNALGNLTLRMIGIREPVRTGLSFHSLEELQYIVQESREGGFLREESGAVLQELLEFADLTAGEVMVPRVRIVGIPLAAPAREVAPILRGSLHTRYPVFTGDLDHIVGVIHVKDVLRLLLSQQGVSETQVHAPPYVPEAAPLDQVLAAMIKARTQMVIVMDEHGGTAGIVTLEDLFEEVIGEIEETTRKPPVHIDAGGIIHAAGTARLEELGEEIDRDLEHEEIDTISGLVLALLGRPPETGDEVVWNGMVFRVTRVEGRGVGECVVEILDTSEANP